MRNSPVTSALFLPLGLFFLEGTYLPLPWGDKDSRHALVAKKSEREIKREIILFVNIFQKHYLQYIYTDIHRVCYIKTLAPHDNILTKTLKEKSRLGK